MQVLGRNTASVVGAPSQPPPGERNVRLSPVSDACVRSLSGLSVCVILISKVGYICLYLRAIFIYFSMNYLFLSFANFSLVLPVFFAFFFFLIYIYRESMSRERGRTKGRGNLKWNLDVELNAMTLRS